MPSNKPNEKLTLTDYIKCDGCGANMEFNPEIGKLYCSHCESTKDLIDEGHAKEIDLLKGFSDDDKWDEGEANVFSCPNCGAKVVLNNGESAKCCPFCGTPHVEKIDKFTGLRPNGVLPFTFGLKKAMELSKAWAKKRWLAPRRFKKNIDAQNLHGVYAPCFTFDSYTTTQYSGKIGITHTRTVGSGENKHTETWTEWRNISGTYYDNFDDILITAGSKLDQKKVDKLAPFDTNNGKQYNSAYLMGFMAYHYDYEIIDCWGQAKEKIDTLVERHILSQYKHDKVAYFNTSTDHERVTYKYVMLPIYVGVFNYRKKAYNFFVNGNTGKVAGKTPLSPFRIFILALLIIGVVILAGYLFINGDSY